MPFNHTKLEKRLSDCDEKLSALFNDVEISDAIKKHIQEVQTYYNLSYTKAQKGKTAEAIVTTYEEYVIHLENVKNGTYWYTTGRYTYEETLKSFNDAKAAMDYANDSRTIDAVKHNLANICALMFWASTALALYASVYLIALPMLIVQTALGIAMGITIGGFFLKSAANCIECFTGFKGFGRHSAEYEHENQLLNFLFKPAQTKSTPKPEAQPDQQDISTEIPCL
ncbi:DUF5638 domain-containing protein [Legionella drancourtii]|uniref:DUF5638 domain-containing protein n=1 Tax=Legionella drancourtii LLAP12 TaxID=658187 RepID=G9EIX8_9GAMM|nr:DUF5638 domain-containing protein [Legionella drancourtii]EHL32896.1 hypothetical protein LDG_5135 [Legionella drancourtii LLAP12]